MYWFKINLFLKRDKMPLLLSLWNKQQSVMFLPSILYFLPLFIHTPTVAPKLQKKCLKVSRSRVYPFLQLMDRPYFSFLLKETKSSFLSSRVLECLQFIFHAFCVQTLFLELWNIFSIAIRVTLQIHKRIIFRFGCSERIIILLKNSDFWRLISILVF